MTSQSVPSVQEQLKAAGYVTSKRNGMKATPLSNTPHRQQVRTEESYYEAIEDLLLNYGCDFFHPTTSHYTRKRRGQKGWPDYVVLGHGWMAFMEIKAVSMTTGKAGSLEAEQRRFKESIELAGGEYVVFTMKRDWDDFVAWVKERTGR